MATRPNRKHQGLLTPPIVRRMCGWSQMKVAVYAGTGVATVRIYELNPLAIADARKRRALDRLYAEMSENVLHLSPLR